MKQEMPRNNMLSASYIAVQLSCRMHKSHVFASLIGLCILSQIETKSLAAVQCELIEFNNWFDLGLQLGLLYHTLKRIEQEQHHSIINCKREMLVAWLKQEDNVMQEGGPSWPQLAKSLERLKCQRLAQKIKKAHCL